MRRPLAAALLAFAAASTLLATATPAAAAPYTVEIVRPQGQGGLSRVEGTRPLVVGSEGLGGPSDVAYVLTTPDGGWDEPAAAPLEQDDDGLWRAEIDTEALPNGRHRLIVRGWGGSAGGYDPNDDTTFSAANLILEVRNAPPAPEGLTVEGGPGSVHIRWEDIPTSDREDFAGYEVYLALADEAGVCPSDPAAYSLRATTFATSHAEGGLDPARYCGTVRSLRTSAATGPIPSRGSEPVVGSVSEGEATITPQDTGQYSPDLPYSPLPTGGPGRAGGPEVLEAGSEEGRRGWLWMAGGLAVAVFAVALLRFVRGAPGDF